MTKRKKRWVLVLDDRLAKFGDDRSYAAGPFESEAQARRYANGALFDENWAFGMRAMLLYRPFLKQVDGGITKQRDRDREMAEKLLHSVRSSIVKLLRARAMGPPEQR